MPSPTFLHGIRTSWVEAPAELRQWVLARTGPLTGEPRDCLGGMATGVAAVLTGPDRAVFVKAVDALDNPRGAEMYRNEAELAGRLPVHPRIPTMIESAAVPVGDGHWQLNLFEARPGRTPAHPWQVRDLDRVLAAWAELRPALRATPWTTSARMVDLFTGWRAALDDHDDPWHVLARRWAGRESAMAARVDGGPDAVLSHIDLRADNILIGDGPEEVAFVDWAHPATAAPWADVALLLGDVVASGAAVETGGAIDVIDTFARLEPDTDPELVVSLISALGAFLHRRASSPVAPGLPHRHVWAAAASEQIHGFVEAHTR